MIDKQHPICITNDCGVHASFGLNKPTHCNFHKLPAMITANLQIVIKKHPSTMGAKTRILWASQEICHDQRFRKEMYQKELKCYRHIWISW